MKHYIFKDTVLALAFCAASAGCTDSFDAMNRDPMGMTDGDLGYMTAYVQEWGTRVGTWEYQVGENLHTNLYAQYFANSAPFFNSDGYTYNSKWVTDGFWNAYYVGVLKQFKTAQAIVDQKPAYGNIFQTMRIFTAMCTAQATDLFGDMPYTQAALGNSNAEYDTQKSIYADIFKELSEAVERLKADKGNATMITFKPKQDLIYDGDLEKWIKLGNSLRLRYAMRLAYIDPETAKKEAEAALAGGGMLDSNADNAGVYISGRGATGWPLLQISGWGEFCMSKTMERMLKRCSSVMDPRTPLWFGHTERSKVENPEYAGIPNGLPVGELAKYPKDARSCVWGLQTAPTWNSKGVGKFTYNIAKRQKVMDYAEVCFLKAEMALRGWAKSINAKSMYLAGIQASFDNERANVDPSLYSTKNDETYKNSGSVAWETQSSLEGHLEQIMTQKWLALYPNGVEAWTEFRRTGYPKLTPVKLSLDPSINADKGEFIKKLRYVDDERRENPNATQKTLNDGRGDGSNVRVWWDTGRYK